MPIVFYKFHNVSFLRNLIHVSSIRSRKFTEIMKNIFFHRREILSQSLFFAAYIILLLTCNFHFNSMNCRLRDNYIA